MSDRFQQFARRVIAGEARGAQAGVLRAVMTAIQPAYAAAVRWRNRKYDRGTGVRRLPRLVVSVGNLTAGGTGKTPVVRWLCERLRSAGGRPAVLMRGYRAKLGERGDEQAMLESLLNGGTGSPVIVHAEPDRHAGGLAVLAAHPDVTAFVMDDGFQHRRLARDFDLVLIDACEPFGFGHVMPRGLLREPIEGLKRADAVLITRADQGDAEAVERVVRRHNAAAPVYRCVHAHVGLRAADGALAPLESLTGRRFFAFAGIGNPDGLRQQLERTPGSMAGHRWFADHWTYSHRDIEVVSAAARAAGAEVLVTTEKDWVKVKGVIGTGALPVVRLELAVRFERPEDEEQLFERLTSRAGRAAPLSYEGRATAAVMRGRGASGKWVVIALLIMGLIGGAVGVFVRDLSGRHRPPATTRTAGL